MPEERSQQILNYKAPHNRQGERAEHKAMPITNL